MKFFVIWENFWSLPFTTSNATNQLFNFTMAISTHCTTDRWSGENVAEIVHTALHITTAARSVYTFMEHSQTHRTGWYVSQWNADKTNSKQLQKQETYIVISAFWSQKRDVIWKHVVLTLLYMWRNNRKLIVCQSIYIVTKQLVQSAHSETGTNIDLFKLPSSIHVFTKHLYTWIYVCEICWL